MKCWIIYVAQRNETGIAIWLLAGYKTRAFICIYQIKFINFWSHFDPSTPALQAVLHKTIKLSEQFYQGFKQTLHTFRRASMRIINFKKFFRIYLETALKLGLFRLKRGFIIDSTQFCRIDTFMLGFKKHALKTSSSAL